MNVQLSFPVTKPQTPNPKTKHSIRREVRSHDCCQRPKGPCCQRPLALSETAHIITHAGVTHAHVGLRGKNIPPGKTNAAVVFGRNEKWLGCRFHTHWAPPTPNSRLVTALSAIGPTALLLRCGPSSKHSRPAKPKHRATKAPALGGSERSTGVCGNWPPPVRRGRWR